MFILLLFVCSPPPLYLLSSHLHPFLSLFLSFLIHCNRYVGSFNEPTTMGELDTQSARACTSCMSFSSFVISYLFSLLSSSPSLLLHYFLIHFASLSSSNIASRRVSVLRSQVTATQYLHLLITLFLLLFLSLPCSPLHFSSLLLLSSFLFFSFVFI